jgi:plastocyanin
MNSSWFFLIVIIPLLLLSYYYLSNTDLNINIKESIENKQIQIMLFLIGLFIFIYYLKLFGKNGFNLEGYEDYEDTKNNKLIYIQIKNFTFQPTNLIINVGDTVKWINNDSIIHTATSYDNLFNSGDLHYSDSYSFTFNKKGTFKYYCIPHPYMIGSIIVK